MHISHAALNVKTFAEVCETFTWFCCCDELEDEYEYDCCMLELVYCWPLITCPPPGITWPPPGLASTPWAGPGPPPRSSSMSSSLRSHSDSRNGDSLVRFMLIEVIPFSEMSSMYGWSQPWVTIFIRFTFWCSFGINDIDGWCMHPLFILVSDRRGRVLWSDPPWTLIPSVSLSLRLSGQSDRPGLAGLGLVIAPVTRSLIERAKSGHEGVLRSISDH